MIGEGLFCYPDVSAVAPTCGQVYLVGLLVVPAMGALVVALMPARQDLAARIVGTVAAAVTLLASLSLLSGGVIGSVNRPVDPWYEVELPWAPGLDVSFHLGVDGISWPLVVLTALLTLLCCGYTLHTVPAPGRGKTLVALLLAIEVGILGTFLALDLVLFFVFFEVVLLPMYVVIAVWGGPGRRQAARKFVLYTLFGSVLLLLGVFTVVSATGTGDLTALVSPGGPPVTGGQGGGWHTDVVMATPVPRGTQIVAFVLLAVAFAVKSPLWPLHTWLPDAHTEAPTVGSVILAGVLLKMGTYGMVRVAVGVLPEGARAAAPVLGVLAVAAIVVGSLVCLAQTELKRLIAYSSVGDMGFVLLGVATLTDTGLQAALIGNVAHGVITGLLFFLAGAVKDRTHTGDLSLLGGLRERAPVLAGLLGFGAIASLGLPGLAGFWGEAFAVYAAFQHGGPLWIVLGVVAAVGGALAAAYFLRMLRLVTHGPASPAVVDITRAQVTLTEGVVWGPLVALTVLIGLVPGLVLWLTADPVDALVGLVLR